MLGFGQDIGIDLGTATIIAYVKGKGVVLREPSVVAVDSNTKEVLAVGQEARRMLGRTPGNIVATRPLREGVISDYTVTEKMLKYFINKVKGKTIFAPRTMICTKSIFNRRTNSSCNWCRIRHCKTLWKYDCGYWRRNNRYSCNFSWRIC